MTALPPIPGPLPGPRSKAALERLGELVYPGTANHLAPFVVAAKSGHLVEDLDGNSFVDLISASASVPLGAARPDLIDPLIETMRRLGNEDSHGIANELIAAAGRDAAGDRAGLADPGRPRPQRHRVGRDGAEDDAPRDRPADRDRLPRRLPRRERRDRRARCRGVRDQPRHPAAERRLRPRSPTPTPTARPSARRARAAAATRRSTTCATTCSSTRSTPATSPASWSSRSSAPAAAWRRHRASGRR